MELCRQTIHPCHGHGHARGLGEVAARATPATFLPPLCQFVYFHPFLPFPQLKNSIFKILRNKNGKQLVLPIPKFVTPGIARFFCVPNVLQHRSMAPFTVFLQLRHALFLNKNWRHELTFRANKSKRIPAPQRELHPPAFLCESMICAW